MNGREEEYLPSPERTAPLLAVSSLPADRARLREILSLENWKLHEASDCRRALPSLRDHSVPVLLCDRDYADGDRGDLLTATERSPAPPNPVVSSGLADESLLPKVEKSGWFRLADDAFRSRGVLARTFVVWSRWERDSVASAAREAELADRSRMPASGTNRKLAVR